MADEQITLYHTRKEGEVKIGKELPSKEFGSKEKIFFPVREMYFYGSKVLFRESDNDGGKELTIFGFKQSMPHTSGDYNQAYLGYEDIDVNHIQEEKTQNEIVERIRRSIPITDMIKYKSFIVEFPGKEAKRHALIKHRDFSRLSK